MLCKPPATFWWIKFSQLSFLQGFWVVAKSKSSHDIMLFMWQDREWCQAFDPGLWLPVPGQGRRNCPFPAGTVQTAWTLSLLVLCWHRPLYNMFFTFLSKCVSVHPTLESLKLRLYLIRFCCINVHSMQFFYTSALQMCIQTVSRPPWQVFTFTNETKHSSLYRYTNTVVSQKK